MHVYTYGVFGMCLCYKMHVLAHIHLRDKCVNINTACGIHISITLVTQVICKDVCKVLSVLICHTAGKLP